MDIKNGTEECLSCKENKRLCKCDSTNSEAIAAWQDTRKQYDVNLVNDPEQDRVDEAKDWVDNGSKL